MPRYVCGLTIFATAQVVEFAPPRSHQFFFAGSIQPLATQNCTIKRCVDNRPAISLHHFFFPLNYSPLRAVGSTAVASRSVCWFPWDVKLARCCGCSEQLSQCQSTYDVVVRWTILYHPAIHTGWSPLTFHTREVNPLHEWLQPLLFFSPKLPCGPCDLVSHSEWEEQKLTIFMNLGEARFAGETVRRNIRLRSWITKSQQKTNKTRARPATEPRLPPARSPETQARKAQHHHRVIPDRMGKP